MNRLKLFSSLAAALMTMTLTAPAFANSLTFQGVTFETLAVDSDTMSLRITNALSGGTGNWANINYLSAFEIKDIGDVTGASLLGWNSNVDNGLSANAGCTTGGTPGSCFFTSPAMALTDNMFFTIDFTGSNLSFDAPHLKVQFFEQLGQNKATGDLLSRAITTPVPEPEIYAMLAAGLGLMGFVARRRKQQAV